MIPLEPDGCEVSSSRVSSMSGAWGLLPVASVATLHWPKLDAHRQLVELSGFLVVRAESMRGVVRGLHRAPAAASATDVPERRGHDAGRTFITEVTGSALPDATWSARVFTGTDLGIFSTRMSLEVELLGGSCRARGYAQLDPRVGADLGPAGPGAAFAPQDFERQEGSRIEDSRDLALALDLVFASLPED